MRQLVLKFNRTVLGFGAISGSLSVSSCRGLSGKAVSLSLLAMVLMTTLAVPASYGQIGPQPPEPKAEKEEGGAVSGLKDSLKNLFKRKDASADEGKEAENTPAQPTDESSEPAAGPAVGGPGPGPAANRPSTPKRQPLLTQPTLSRPVVEAPEKADDMRKIKEAVRLNNPDNPLGLTRGRKLLTECMATMESGNMAETNACIVPVRQWLIDATEAHISLYKTLNQVGSAKAQAELEKQLALEFALLRDKAFFTMAKVYIARKDYTKAIKELTEVVKSQPRSDLGIKAYETLQEIGFTTRLQITD